jgi:hypothetical protein
MKEQKGSGERTILRERRDDKYWRQEDKRLADK